MSGSLRRFCALPPKMLIDLSVFFYGDGNVDRSQDQLLVLILKASNGS